MISDPYKVLGVGEQATDDELKKAYRELSKKWHPDANPDRPELAEEKFKEIQEAYRQIVDARARGTSAYGRTAGQGASYGGTSYGRPGGGYADYGGMGGFEEFFNQWANYSGARRAQEESNELTAARNYISNGHYREAMNALRQVPEAARGARWNYLAAIASQGLGSNIDSLKFARAAAAMEPGNPEYAELVRRLENGGNWYQSRGESYGGLNPVNNTTGWCLSMCALNMFCNCCFGYPMWC